ncbi:MAG: hypothetical protein GF350_03885 [Chitinivibrionales bacterium]|nr:hypothetical protein [Chitinivibrionales bacterium]
MKKKNAAIRYENELVPVFDLRKRVSESICRIVVVELAGTGVSFTCGLLFSKSDDIVQRE